MNADQLDSMPLKDLRALAAGRGVANSAKLKKAELVAALRQAAPRHEPPAPSAGPAGSSAPPQPAAWQPAAPEHGLPIPDGYARDRVVLMVQDPSHIFAYWEVAPGTLDRVRAEAGGHGAAVLVLHGPGGSEQREVDLGGGNYYLAVAPDSTYTAELCLRAPDGRLIRIASSNEVHTPAAGPSWRTDESWMEVDEHFQDLLALAGAPGQIGSSLGGGSGQRFRNQRQLRVRPIGLEAEGGAITPPAAASGGPSSLAVASRGVESWSSAALSSAALVRGVALGSGSGSGLGLLGGSSGQLLSSGALSSRALSSRALSSRSLSSGALVEGHEELQYPVDGVFHAPPTGLPKAAEGVPSTPPPPAGPPPAPAAAAGNTPPAAPNAAAPAPPHDPLAFIGAPKPAAQRKPKPPRA